MKPILFRSPRGIAFQLSSIFLFIMLFTWILLYILFIKTEFIRHKDIERTISQINIAQGVQIWDMRRADTRGDSDGFWERAPSAPVPRIPGGVDQVVEEVYSESNDGEVEHASDWSEELERVYAGEFEPTTYDEWKTWDLSEDEHWDD
ncbi:hypothetical protein BGZ60DRAFT_420199 [Tricladium varicosporioides]|nr:hypothetical protein BGZ60DRAFT_420199 [Hymenoscyphus varicosporioides]